MIRNWWTRLVSLGQPREPQALAGSLLAQVQHLQAAKDLRDVLRSHAKAPAFQADLLPQLVDELRRRAWPDIEIEKTLAYADFFSGADERGYQRVMQHDLAKSDFAMFMTGCVFCYLADRCVEGAALVDRFDPYADATTDWPEYWAFAGYMLFAAGRPVENALAHFDQALAQGALSPLLATNAYPIYFEAGRLDACQTLKAYIQSHCAEDPDALFALACVELARGYYGEGFRWMEARYRMPESARSMNMSLLQKPRWEGQSLAGKRLLVHGEQGLGDMIMMARYLPLLQAQGAELLLDGRAEALSLMAHNFPECTFVEADLNHPIAEPFDYWTGLMSLPYHLKTTALEVPATEGYLSVPEETASYWRERLREPVLQNRLRVGIAWSGNPGHRADKRRSMPFERMATLVRQHADVLFFSLQTHVPAHHPVNLLDISDELLTLADTAAALCEMDLILSVDTSTIHLAGALGKTAWLLLPHRYEWRWGLEGEGNPWYSSVRVLRQPRPGAWAALMDTAGSALQRLKHDQLGA